MDKEIFSELRRSIFYLQNYIRYEKDEYVKDELNRAVDILADVIIIKNNEKLK